MKNDGAVNRPRKNSICWPGSMGQPRLHCARMMRHARVVLAILPVVLFGLLALLPGSAQEHPGSSPAEHPGLPAARSTNSDVHQTVRDYVKKRSSKGVF